MLLKQQGLCCLVYSAQKPQVLIFFCKALPYHTLIRGPQSQTKALIITKSNTEVGTQIPHFNS